ncbi:MAG: F0F1 ATP synthase subunit epsilon [Calditrichaeota bacterium]|nr:F0F1 ATP synthase subunit epsilon [Calditrichota bacterium]
MDKLFKFKIVTPQAVLLSDEVSRVQAPGVTGSFGVMAHHIPYLTALTLGSITVETGKKRKVFATSGGFAEVINGSMTILAESAEDASQIDIKRAEKARDRAIRRLRGNEPGTDIHRARAALVRALNRLEIAATGRVFSG